MNFSNRSQVINRIINEYMSKTFISKEESVKLISEQITKDMKMFLLDEEKRIRYALNSIDFNTKVLLESHNGFFISNNLDEKLPLINEFESPLIAKAKRNVKEEIYKAKYKKHNAVY